MKNIYRNLTILLAFGIFQVGLGQQITTAQKEVKMSADLKGITTVDTQRYVIEIPTGWTVGNETPWGARDITPKTGNGQFGAMTAGPTKAGWDELYKTSLFFVKREEPGTETPYRTGKTKQGYDSMAFEVKNKDGFFSRRYTLIRSAAGNVLALSIRIPSPDQEKKFIQMFQHMIDTAKLKD